MMQGRALMLVAVAVSGGCGGSAGKSPDTGSFPSDSAGVLPDSRATTPDTGSTSSDASPSGPPDSGASP
ncbi:MAG TPA: hypothetical protein VJ801_07190, partial [Polyangia bacterium]|nr:hypothetical protein [Polyangia bacterium]